MRGMPSEARLGPLPLVAQLDAVLEFSGADAPPLSTPT